VSTITSTPYTSVASSSNSPGRWITDESHSIVNYNCLRPLQHWDRGFESHLGMDVCVCSVCANFELNLLVKLNEK
jgi:hypothetical protein